jgi:hypothetical protein
MHVLEAHFISHALVTKNIFSNFHSESEDRAKDTKVVYVFVVFMCKKAIQLGYGTFMIYEIFLQQ